MESTSSGPREGSLTMSAELIGAAVGYANVSTITSEREAATSRISLPAMELRCEAATLTPIGKFQAIASAAWSNTRQSAHFAHGTSGCTARQENFRSSVIETALVADNARAEAGSKPDVADEREPAKATRGPLGGPAEVVVSRPCRAYKWRRRLPPSSGQAAYKHAALLPRVRVPDGER